MYDESSMKSHIFCLKIGYISALIYAKLCIKSAQTKKLGKDFSHCKRYFLSVSLDNAVSGVYNIFKSFNKFFPHLP